MLDKKGGIAVEEISGILIFVFVAFVVLLFFYGCIVTSIKKDFEEFKFSRDEIEIVKELNYILEKPIGVNKTVSDLIIEVFEEDYPSLDDNKIYSEMGKIEQDYFPRYSRLAISLPTAEIGDLTFLYNPSRMGEWVEFGSELPIGSVILPVPKEEGFWYIEVLMG